MYFFVLYSSFDTLHAWGEHYELCYFLLDFDGWLHLTDILKRATWLKPDVAFVWPMQCAWMASKHMGGGGRVGFGWGGGPVDKSYPRPLAGRLFSRVGLRGKIFHQKRHKRRKLTQSIRRTRGQAWVWILLKSPHPRIRAFVPPEGSHMPYLGNYCYIVLFCKSSFSSW